MPIVLITLAVGIWLGYWIARKQLRGKFLMAEELLTATPLLTVNPSPSPTKELPGPWCRPEESPLSAQWGLPNYHNAYPHVVNDESPLIITKRAPDGYSAKQILGYAPIGRKPVEPSYPEGFRGWKIDHGQMSPDEDEDE